METEHNCEYRKVQGLVGETSFSVILPKQYAITLGIGKGDFVKVSQDNGKIVLEKATEQDDRGIYDMMASQTRPNHLTDALS